MGPATPPRKWELGTQSGKCSLECRTWACCAIAEQECLGCRCKNCHHSAGTAVAAYAQAALTAFTDVENALSNEQIVKKREAFLQVQVGENPEALRLMNIKYDVGQIDLLSVLQITQRLIASELGLIGIRNQRLAQRVNLHLALGESLKRNRFAANRVLARPGLQSKSSHLLLCPGHRDSDALTLIAILTIMTGSVFAQTELSPGKGDIHEPKKIRSP